MSNKKKVHQGIRVNLIQQPVIACKLCKNEYFKALVKIRVISPVLIGSTLKTYAMEQYFECTKCQAVICISTDREEGIELVKYDARQLNNKK